MSNKKQACEKRIYKVTKDDLPLSCPMADMALWDAHPKVYLPIEKTGKAECEYCSAQYILTDFSKSLTDNDTTGVEYADANH
jgi:uncharacterized Zn-finger protein